MQDIRERTEAKRQAIIDNLLHCIENNPKIWEKGWYSVTDSPLNGKSNKKYQGFNALYLSILASIKGYNDPRWMTFNQVKEMGGYVNAGEKASEIFFYQLYDKNTKKEFDEKTVEGMTPEERKKYIDTNTYRPIKFYQVFNAAQCKGLPAYDKPQMSSEEQSRQINLIQNVIKNSAAPISYDGGSRAYYNTKTDSIHLPKVSDFKSMQDYYATALHEIAHSTGHTSRLNRDLNGGFGSESYAVEELRAELSSVFMQLDLGLQLEGKHIENHGAYLSSWLKAVKDDKNILFKTIRDAEKISDYVVENYANKEEQKAEVESEKPVFEPNSSFATQVDAVLSGADTISTHLKVMSTPFILRQLGANNLPILIRAKKLKKVATHSQNNSHLHGLEVDVIKKLPELIADPVMVMDSLTKDDSVVILTSTIDNENRPIIGAIKFDGKGYIDSVRLEANILTSLYGKDNFNDFIQRNINAGTILYWNKEKSQELIEVPGVQFPNKLNSLASNIIIRKAKAFVNSFSQKNQNDTNEIANNTKSATKEIEKYTEPYRSYLAEQGDNPDIIYFKRIGDFYEIMGDNAKIIAEELDLTLISRSIGQEERVPMCGIPYHALDNYLKKLNDKYSADIKENGIYLTSIKTQEKQSQQVEQAKQVGQVEQVEINPKANDYVVIDLQFNYSNEMLFSNELQKMGFYHDFSIQSENDKRDTYAFEEQIPYWTNEIKYINNDNSKIISGVVGRVSNGIIVESTDITRFYLTNFTNSEVEQFVNILNNFGVANKVKLLEKQVEQFEQAENNLANLPLLVNYFAGPSAGKTTAALELTAALKKEGYNVEYVSEFSKELVLENRIDELSNQEFVTDEQYHRLDRLRNSVDIIVTDSPVLLGKVYGEKSISEEYSQQIKDYHNSFENLNLFVARSDTFQTEGRVHNLEQSKELDNKIITMLRENNVMFDYVQQNDTANTVATINKLFENIEHSKTTQEKQSQQVEQVKQAEQVQFKTEKQMYKQHKEQESRYIKAKKWDEMDSVEGVYVETTYEYFDKIPTMKLEKSQKGEVWRIVGGKGDKSEYNFANAIFDENTALEAFKQVKLFIENENKTNREQFKRMTVEQLNDWISQYGENEYVGKSVWNYNATSALEDKQTQQAQLEARKKAWDEYVKTQEKQSQQVEQAKQVGQAEQVEYLKIDIPKEQYGGEYGRSVMIKMPKGSEYSSFVFFAPKNFVKQQNSNGDYILTVKNTSLCELKNDGMSVELTGKELSTAIVGKEVGKSAKRVAPSHRTVNNLERINSNIPDEMKNKPNWCVYKARWNSEKGKKDKYIYSPILGLDEKGKLQWASIDKPDTWSTFDRALEFAKENNCEGLVFALDGSGISCIDLDKAIAKNGFLNGKPTDLKDGELNDVAKKIVPNMSDTYIEKSTSGNGFHIFVKDDILKGNHYKNRAELEKGDEIEVYDNKRFISMTGDCDSKKDLTQCPQETMSYIRETLGKKQTVNVENYNRSSSFNKSDAEVIACIEKSKKGSVFKQLYNGADITGDNSRNDFMLMNILAYFTDCDADQMERIFKNSGLYRPQKQDGYYKTTINSAIGSLYQRPSFGNNKPFGKGGGKNNKNSK